MQLDEEVCRKLYHLCFKKDKNASDLASKFAQTLSEEILFDFKERWFSLTDCLLEVATPLLTISIFAGNIYTFAGHQVSVSPYEGDIRKLLAACVFKLLDSEILNLAELDDSEKYIEVNKDFKIRLREYRVVEYEDVVVSIQSPSILKTIKLWIFSDDFEEVKSALSMKTINKIKKLVAVA